MYNILVVDDDKEIVESIEIYLKNEGFNIFKAYNGIEALEILVEKEIHLILMDIMMPKFITFLIFHSSYFTSTEPPINSLIIELFTMLSSSSTSST